MAKICGFCEKSAPAGGMACRCSVTGNVHGCDHPCDVADMPRLCQVLGVAVGQRFKVRNSDGDMDGPFFIRDDGGISCPVRDIGALDLLSALIMGINHPEKIERLPRLTPEELQRCRDFGAKWVSRDEDGELVHLWETEPEPQPGGVWAGGKSCAQTWKRFFPSVQPGQLVPVEGVS